MSEKDITFFLLNALIFFFLLYLKTEIKRLDEKMQFIIKELDLLRKYIYGYKDVRKDSCESRKQ